MRVSSPIVALLLSVTVVAGCLVPKAKYDALNAELVASRAAAESAAAEQAARVTSLESALAEAEQQLAALDAQYATMTTEHAAAVAAWETERSALVGEKASLLKDRSALKSSLAETQQALDELAARRAAAEARVREYRSLLDRFKALIDSGKLKVKIVDGRMVVELATDVLFASGKADLSETGRVAVSDVATALAGIPERSFQVEGHTDDKPIATERFPSNWELASARAIVVVRALVAGGLPPERVSAAAFAEYRPVADNASDAGRAANRRIEIVVVPDLSLLPGTEELERASRE